MTICNDETMTMCCSCLFVFNDTATTEIYTYCHTLSLHDALPISRRWAQAAIASGRRRATPGGDAARAYRDPRRCRPPTADRDRRWEGGDRKSTRLNSSH